MDEYIERVVLEAIIFDNVADAWDNKNDINIQTAIAIVSISRITYIYIYTHKSPKAGEVSQSNKPRCFRVAIPRDSALIIPVDFHSNLTCNRWINLRHEEGCTVEHHTNIAKGFGIWMIWRGNRV